MNTDWDEYFLNFILFLEKNNIKIDWYLLSYNLNITIYIINKYNYLPWDKFGIFHNPNLTNEFLQKYSINQTIKNNPTTDLDYSWAWMSSNIIIIETNLDYDWYSISSQPNITFSFILRYIKLFKNNIFSYNDFTIQKRIFYKYKFITFISSVYLPNELVNYIFNYFIK
jgi:hypothetical protein